MDEIPTIQVFKRYRPMEVIVLATQGLDRSQVDEALEKYAQIHDLEVGTILGVTMGAAVFTPVPDWDHEDNPDPADVYFVEWETIHIILGKNKL